MSSHLPENILWHCLCDCYGLFVCNLLLWKADLQREHAWHINTHFSMRAICVDFDISSKFVSLWIGVKIGLKSFLV